MRSANKTIIRRSGQEPFLPGTNAPLKTPSSLFHIRSTKRQGNYRLREDAAATQSGGTEWR